ncbi:MULTISPECIES: energy transducer TonB [Shewanella]|uniref:energy transducer TonB n=1 Tax=Shewanella TaxID=22 RepID=UPI00166582F0|nr:MULTISPECIES: energy transducer TonB [Shewanella]MCL1071743.1 TonB family protein [Shewanella xiamenensis]MCR4535690.1 TonB family protein [Shewanella xiamenensis]MDI5849048.1 TonB family protein [Shewanella xiamenensis]MEE1979331.1 TonB family protein [Shewanella xiamenensis]QRK78734.1 TonB family protein [Shewanella sp. LZH-2]
MTPKRYLAFGALTVAIQTGVIASQPTPAQLKIVNSPTIQGESHQRVTLNPVTLNFAKPQIAAASDAAGNTVNKTHHASLVQTVTTPSTRTAQPKLTTSTPKKNVQSKTEQKQSITASIDKKTIAQPKSKQSQEHHYTANTDNLKSTEKMAPHAELVPTKPTPSLNEQQNSMDSNMAPHQTVVELTSPTFASQPPQPTYPRMARKKGLEGTATIEVMFNEFGQQLALTLVKSSGVSLLDQAALEAVETWQFEAPSPKLASHYKVRVPIRFALN